MLTAKALGALILKTAAVVGTTAVVKKVVDTSCKNTCKSCTNCKNNNGGEEVDKNLQPCGL